MTSPVGSGDWHYAQIFGDKGAGEEVTEADIITAVEFDSTGDNIAIGDRGGRVVILRRSTATPSSLGSPGTPSSLSSTSGSSYLSSVSSPSSGVMGGLGSPAAGNRTRSPSLFKKTPSQAVVEYRLYTEFQSHTQEFDYLKSVEIEEKINQIRWLPGSSNACFMLTTNDKTIKLWKVYERSVQQVSAMSVSQFQFSAAQSAGISSLSPLPLSGVQPSGGSASPLAGTYAKHMLRLPRIQHGETVVTAQQRKVYPNAHAYHINSLSLNSDGESFISADDLRVNLWNLNVPNLSFNAVDIKPSNMEELNEVITSATFHPQHCSTFMYSTSRGIIKLLDMRQSAICDAQGAAGLSGKVFEGPAEPNRTFFSEIVCSISDAKFSRDGRYILSRDYLTLKVWDINMEARPLRVINVHDSLRARICDLYENDCVFDKFECAVSGDGAQYLSGSYQNMFYIFDQNGRTTAAVEASRVSPKKKTTRTRLGALGRTKKGTGKEATAGAPGGPVPVSSSPTGDLDYSKKVLHTAWHPTENIIACSSLNHLYVYNYISQ